MEHSRNSFDLLRLFAALLVLAGHSSDLLRMPAPTIFGRGTHVIGIYIFFVISGFLIAGSLQRDRNLWRFAARRALRILPALWACTAVMIAMGAVATTLSLAEYFLNPQTLGFTQNAVLRIRFFLPGVFEQNPYKSAVNGSLWSLPVEVLCYAVCYLLLLLGRRGLALGAALQLAGWIAVASGYDVSITPDPLSLVLSLSIYFILGAGLSYFPQLIRLDVAIPLLLGVILLPPSQSLDWALPPVLTYAVVAVGLRETTLSAIPRRIGDLSYGIYLYAFPTQQFLIWLIGPQWLKPQYLTPLAAVCALALAYLSWHWVEKRALALKPRKPATAAAPVGLPLPEGTQASV